MIHVSAIVVNQQRRERCDGVHDEDEALQDGMPRDNPSIKIPLHPPVSAGDPQLHQ